MIKKFLIMYLTILISSPNVVVAKTINTNQYILLNQEINSNSHVKKRLLRKFYFTNHYNFIWLQNNILNEKAIEFINTLKNSYLDGLNPDEYNINEIQTLIENNNSYLSDKILPKIEVLLSDSFFKYVENITQGVIDVRKFYPDWDIKKHNVNSLQIIDAYINTNYNLDNLIPSNQNYQKLKQKLKMYYDILKEYKELPAINDDIKLSINVYNSNVLALSTRLEITDNYKISVSNIFGYYDHSLKNAVIKFQLNHGLHADGVVGAETLQQLNMPIFEIIKKISLNMDRVRWLTDDSNNEIIVNIPDFSLNVIENNHNIINMPVIVGSNRQLQSCVLTSEIKAIIFNPYWYIPDSIVKNEIIPKFILDSSYLMKNNIKVYKSTDKINPVTDLSDIDLTKVDEIVSKYKFIQDSGESNSLGRIKFVFDNKCGIYLHDTSAPSLFKSFERNLSHGCIRIEDPVALATHILQQYPEWTKDKIIDTISSNVTKYVKLETPNKIEILYLTTWVDANNELQFRNDIYSYDELPYNPYLFE